MVAIAFGFRHNDTLLHQLDARIKLAGLVTVSIVTINAGMSALVLAFFTALLLLGMARCSPLRCLFGMKWHLVLLACVLLTRTLTTPGDLLIESSWLPATRQGVFIGLLFAGRLLVIALFALLVTFTTRPSHIRCAVEWFLRPIPGIPHRQVATMIGLLVRFIPVILTQSAELDLALRARSIDNRRNPLRRLTFLGMPLLRRTFVTADRLASAMEARCYGLHGTPHQWQVTARDWSALGFLSLFCLLLVALP
jgi:energy-coupling factor transporter transmembrane protein EcfT